MIAIKDCEVFVQAGRGKFNRIFNNWTIFQNSTRSPEQTFVEKCKKSSKFTIFAKKLSKFGEKIIVINTSPR